MVSFLCAISLVGLQSGWEVKKLGTGGETYVSSDGHGAVYASSHIPTQVFASRDWGATFTKAGTFPDSLGDTVVLALPDGRVLLTYMTSPTDGFRSQLSTDFGKTWSRGTPPHARPLDREWPAYDAKTKTMYLIYSDGYIGGPKSKGIFLSVSRDYGRTWTETGRIDKETEGNYAVDPHLVLSQDGKLYAFWTVSSDYDKIDSMVTAVSADGGKTFTQHQHVVDYDRSTGGDYQERWMLGGLAAFGDNTLSVFYTDYDRITVDGAKNLVFRAKVKTSLDGGKTFGPALVVGGPNESAQVTSGFQNRKISNENNPYPMQVLPWGSYDEAGLLHMVWMDNRDGQAMLKGKAYSKWHLRASIIDPKADKQGVSDRIGTDFIAARPALDFICCTVDSKFMYVTWTQNENSASGSDFSGQFYFARKPLKP